MGTKRTHSSKADDILNAQVREDIVDVNVPGDAEDETRRISPEMRKQKLREMISEGH